MTSPFRFGHFPHLSHHGIEEGIAGTIIIVGAGTIVVGWIKLIVWALGIILGGGN